MNDDSNESLSEESVVDDTDKDPDYNFIDDFSNLSDTQNIDDTNTSNASENVVIDFIDFNDWDRISLDRIPKRKCFSEAWNHYGILMRDNIIFKPMCKRYFCQLCFDARKFKRYIYQFWYEPMNDYCSIFIIHSSYAHSTGLTNLLSHLQNKHEITISTARTQEKQQQLTNVFFPAGGNASESNSKSSFVFFRHLTLWFCRDLVPLNTVDKKGFNDFWAYLQTEFELPCRSTISIGALDDLYVCCKNKLIERLTSSGSHATITFDGWTDNHKKVSYITYTYHYIEDWTMKTAVLKTGSFAHPHTSERIKEDFEGTLAEFNVLNKRFSIVTDGASSMIKSAELLSVYRFGCVGHIIHLLFRKDLLKHDSMDDLRTLKTKIQKIHKKLMYRHETLGAFNDEINQKKILELLEEFQEMGIFTIAFSFTGHNIKTTFSQYVNR